MGLLLINFTTISLDSFLQIKLELFLINSSVLFLLINKLLLYLFILLSQQRISGSLPFPFHFSLAIVLIFIVQTSCTNWVIDHCNWLKSIWKDNIRVHCTYIYMVYQWVCLKCISLQICKILQLFNYFVLHLFIVSNFFLLKFEINFNSKIHYLVNVIYQSLKSSFINFKLLEKICSVNASLKSLDVTSNVGFRVN